jgi:hypothetical protein
MHYFLPLEQQPAGTALTAPYSRKEARQIKTIILINLKLIVNDYCAKCFNITCPQYSPIVKHSSRMTHS